LARKKEKLSRFDVSIAVS